MFILSIAVVNGHLFHNFYCQTYNINIGNIYETILAIVFLLWKIKKIWNDLQIEVDSSLSVMWMTIDSLHCLYH